MNEDNTNVILPAEEIGVVTFANDVLAIIAGLAATEIEGVAGMSGGIAGGIAELLGRKNLAKGIKATVTEKTVSFDVNMIATFGFKLHEVARNVQNNVIKAVETMTGLDVLKVNVNILGVNFPKEAQPQPTDSGSAE